MQEPPSSDTHSLLHQLIKLNLPSGLEPLVLTQYYSYFARLLSSDLSPQYSKQEDQIRVSMENHIDEIDPRDKISKKQKLSQIMEQLSRRSSTLTRKSAVLRMLYCVARAEYSDRNYIGSGALY